MHRLCVDLVGAALHANAWPGTASRADGYVGHIVGTKFLGYDVSAACRWCNDLSLRSQVIAS